jgi:hypothetical protein
LSQKFWAKFLCFILLFFGGGGGARNVYCSGGSQAAPARPYKTEM